MISAEERREREEAVANALASVRLEGLDPVRAELVLQRWARGEITDEQFQEAKRRFVTGEPVDDLLPDRIDRPA